MYRYARLLRGTGAKPWRRASAQVMRPFPLSSYSAGASVRVAPGRRRRRELGGGTRRDDVDPGVLASRQSAGQGVALLAVDGPGRRRA